MTQNPYSENYLHLTWHAKSGGGGGGIPAMLDHIDYVVKRLGTQHFARHAHRRQ
jgi:hypothetical protein